MNTYGRAEIFTDVPRIDSSNIIQVLRDAYIQHTRNASECEFLLNYEAGKQTLNRVKTFRSDIDNVCIDNVANEITEFKLGFKWANPVTLVQRGIVDKGKKSESKAITLLNEQYETVGIRSKTQELARFIEICGIGHTYIDINTRYVDGDSYFNLEVLDPRNSFVAKSSYYTDKRPMLGVTYRKDSLGNYHFTCFTDEFRFEIINIVKVVNEEVVEDWSEKTRSGEKNPLGIIPIIEWIRSYDRMGCFERQIPEMDNLNLLVSDFTNDVDQNTQAVFLGIDIEFPLDKDGNEIRPKSNDWLLVNSTKDGRNPSITPIAVNYDYVGMLNNIATRRATILQKCNVPQRNDNSGGSTGIAMSDATGWSSAEASACKDEAVTSICKMREVKVVLEAIKKSPNIQANNPMLKLKYSDVVPSIKRQKSYELTTKMNAIATGISHGIDYKALLKEIPMFSDPQQVIEDSAPTIERYLKSIFDKNESNGLDSEKKPNADRLGADESDQITNSPKIDGMSKENPNGGDDE